MRFTRAEMADKVEIEKIKHEHRIVGRDSEIERGLTAIRVNRHLMIEGPVGVGKTVLANAIASYLGRPVYRVDGDERYTEQKLSGWFDPPIVLEKGYIEEAFIPGPLTEAMRNGGVLFINEMNRMPEGVQNILLPAMDEGIIEIPKVGRVEAVSGFVVIATQNPREFVATTALSEALSDRFELLLLDYQPEAEEFAILRGKFPDVDEEATARALWIMRRTRNHPNIRRGASIRAAMSMMQLMGPEVADLAVSMRRAAHMALPTRIELREESRATVADVIDTIVDECFELDGVGQLIPRPEEPGPLSDPVGPEERKEKKIDISDIADVLEMHGQTDMSNGDMGWRIAQNFSRLRLRLTDPVALEMARRIAIRATIRRVLQLLGPVSLPMQKSRETYVPGVDADIDIESTLENMVESAHLRPEDIVVERRNPRKLSVALMLDASLSMSGDKLAIATAAIAVIALRLKMVDYLVVTFNDRPKVVKRLDDDKNLDDLLASLLDFNASGYTNIEEALKKGAEELSRADTRNQVGVLITDGNYTVGRDPSASASSFRKLFVIMTKSHDCRADVCEDTARNGKGRMYTVSGFDEIPRVLYNVLRMVAQGSSS